MILRAAALALSLTALPAAGDIVLGVPVDCTLGKTCFIQNHVDHDPGPGAADFTCGSLVYDGHKGTDFALPTVADMARGVAVRAAAPGTVRAIRDGLPDTGPDIAPPAGKDCGNGLVLDHGGGWQTQYCHLARGSVTVAPGQRVAMGAVLGQIGLSGRTEFPHLHLSVRRDGAVVDPFRPKGALRCPDAPAPGATLWQDPPAYRASGLIGAGLTPDLPDFDAVKAGLDTPASLPAGAPALIAWAHLFGARAGDEMTFALFGPAGRLATREITLDRTQARLFRAFGKRRPPGGWPPGAYRAEIAVIRDRAALDRIVARVTVR